jgi:hypothetical protein
MFVAGSDEIAADGILDDEGCGTVFDGAAGVGPLGFAEDLNAREMLGQLIEADEGGVADALEERRAEGGGFGGRGHHLI